MAHSLYFISTLQAITDNQDALGQFTFMPSDANFTGDFTPDMEMVVCALPLSSINLPVDFTMLPDALRNKEVGVDIAAKLTTYGVQPIHSTFDVVDILTRRSGSFAFVIK